MKSQKTNTIQLIIAGFVVVLVAICGTFAWFAVSNSSTVAPIGATVASPSIESGFGEIQIYDPAKKEWVEYDGEDPLSFIPGQSYSFRVTFYAGDEQHIWLDLKEISDSGGNEDYQLYNALTYRVKTPAEPEPGYSLLANEISEEDGKLNARIINGLSASDFEQRKDLKRVCYYDLKLDGETADNNYVNKKFNANVELTIS